MIEKGCNPRKLDKFGRTVYSPLKERGLDKEVA